MQPHTIDRRTKVPPKITAKDFPQKSTESKGATHSQYVIDEINAYIAIRDMRIAAAESSTTPENLRQATLANDFVETCLTRPPVIYAAQHLPEPDAAFERKRCEIVKARIAELQAAL
jgi:hypothetical protein